jgi:hypothetical protein
MGPVQQPGQVAGKTTLLVGFLYWLVELDSHHPEW